MNSHRFALPIALASALVASPLFASDPVSEDEGLTIAREIAGHSFLATIGPLQTGAEVEAILADAPDLTEEEQASLRAIGRERADALGKAALEAEAQALATALSVEDLRAIAAFERSPAAANHRAAAPMVMAAVMEELAGVDYKREVKRSFCERTGKLCE